MASFDEAKEIIKSTPISSIVTMYIPINKKGGNFEAVCPFHSDTNPSLKINDDKGIYKCFVCGAAGDSIKFVQDKLNLDFRESIKDIANNLGITVKENNNKKADPKYDLALRVVQSANRLYRKVADELKPENYRKFAANRNLSAETLTEFQIGYAPNNNSLTNYLNSLPADKKELALKVAEEIGIIRPQKYGGGHYDFYRERVTFPIWDHQGKVRGFSTRAVLPDQKPKYLNSKESFVFDKGNIMFGFNFAKKHIRESDAVIIVEGNMDVIMLHQYGFKNSVATMGVSLSAQSIKLLTNMTKNIYLAMDSDPAGIAAMSRINSEFLDQNIIPKFISFAPSKDPDEFLNEFGRLELKQRIEDAPSFIDFQIKQLIPQEIPERTDQKLEILQKVFAVLSPLKAHLLATEKAIQTGKSLGLRSSADDIVKEYKEFLENNKSNYKVQKNIQQPAQPEEPAQFQEDRPEISEDIPQIETIPIQKIERLILETILTHPECVVKSQMLEILDKLQHFEVKRIVLWVKEIYFEIDENDYGLFLKEKNQESLPEEIKAAISSALFNYNPTKLEDKVADKMLSDFLIGLEIQHLKNQKAALISKQRAAATDEEGLEILGQIQELEKKLRAYNK